MEEIAEVVLDAGRMHLVVAGFRLAAEGDRCRDDGLPESVLPPISEDELAALTFGGEPAKDLPISLVRLYRGDDWTLAMLEHVAAEINRRAREA